VVVALVDDPRQRIQLESDAEGRVFQGILPARGKIRVVVADLARNETAREVEPR
jgi:hypothetical protein